VDAILHIDATQTSVFIYFRVFEV
jgi:hypothetical protein